MNAQHWKLTLTFRFKCHGRSLFVVFDVLQNSWLQGSVQGVSSTKGRIFNWEEDFRRNLKAAAAANLGP